MRYTVFLLFLAACMLLVTVYAPHVVADSSFTVTITIQGLPADLATNVYVNGNRNDTLSGGASVTYTFSGVNAPYFVSVDNYVQGSDNQTRYYCQNTSWEASGAGSQVFTYVTQYYLEVQTAYSTASGQGWYTAGSTAQAVVSDQEASEGQGTRNIFNGWGGDASGTQPTSNPITMDAPKVATANWKTQFFLTLESDPSNVTGLSGAGWYDSGTQANFSAVMTVPVSSTTRLRFNHWSGEFNGQQPGGSVSMDRPKIVKADYIPQYFLTVQYSPASLANSYNETRTGWYDANSQVQLGPVPTVVGLSTVERLQFTSWSDAGSDSKNLSYTVLVDRPRNVTLSYVTQYYLEVQSTYGVVSGSGWYNRGATATITAPTSSGTWPISYSLSGWTVDPPTEALVDNSTSWTIVVNGPYVVQAQWSINYLPVVLVFGGSALAVTAVAVGGLLGYKRGSFARRRTRSHPEKMAPAVVPGIAVGPTCGNCGNPVPTGEAICGRCGAAVSPPQIPSNEDKVYDYILNHQGVISLTAASTDLGIPVDELKEMTERLKSEGRLS